MQHQRPKSCDSTPMMLQRVTWEKIKVFLAKVMLAD